MNAKLSSKCCLSRTAFPILILLHLWFSGILADDLLSLLPCPMQPKGATHLLLLFYDLQMPALYFSTQMKNSKPAASQIWLPELQRLTGTAGCSARAAALPLQPQREPDAGSMLGWGSRRARAAALGVTEHWVICSVPRLLCGGDVSRLYLLQAESKERSCISICVCEISSVREILLGLP